MKELFKFATIAITTLIIGFIVGVNIVNEGKQPLVMDTIDYTVVMVAYKTGWYNGVNCAFMERCPGAVQEDINLSFYVDSAMYSSKILKH